MRFEFTLLYCFLSGIIAFYTFTITYFIKCKRPDAVGGQLHRVQQRHLDQPVRFCPSGGPVLVTLHLKTITDTSEMRLNRDTL